MDIKHLIIPGGGSNFPILNDVLTTSLGPSIVFFVNEGLPLSSYDMEYCIATNHPLYCVCLLLGG